MRYKAIIFDLDGTLVHTKAEYRYMIVGQALRDLGVVSSNAHIDKFWFETSRNVIIRKIFGVQPKLFWKRFRKYDTAELRKQHTSVYDDIGYIQELRSYMRKIGIVTGAPIHIANLEIKMLGRENFDAIVIAHSLLGIEPKPNPQGIEECLGIMKVDKADAIYVGNSGEDLTTAENAGISFAFLDRGEYKFLGINPPLTITSLYDLRGPLYAQGHLT